MSDKERFIAELYPAARRVSRETDMAWETILAQAAQETGWGKRVLAGTNNIFNIKADTGWHGPSKTFNVWEIEGGKKVWKDQSFRVYASIDEALRDRVAFLRDNPRYARAGLFEEGTLGNFEKEAAALQKAGYATDPRYAQNLVRVFHGATMRSGVLLAEGQAPDESRIAKPPIRHSGESLRFGSRGPEVHKLQLELNALGYHDADGRALRADGDFGGRTKEALQAFQRAHGIDPIAVVGPRTRAALREAECHLTPVDPAHPDHVLHDQGVAAVQRLDAETGRQRDTQSERLAASVTQLAKESGLTRIDHVVAGNNGNVFVVQGGLDDPARRVAHMPMQAALAAPVSESFRQLAQHQPAVPEQAAVPVRQAHFEHHEGLRRAPAP
jgi:hypothetical protein